MTDRTMAEQREIAHALNEWADLASNAIQWIKNIRAGISLPDEALKELWANYERVLALSRAALRTPPPDQSRAGEPVARRWKHKKRGTVYTEIGRGLLQTADAGGLTDNELMVIYRNDETGTLWVRDETEFNDGRFEPIQEPRTPIPPTEGERVALADDPATVLEGWAKAYRDNPQFRFPSDPDAEFFPVDLDNAARLLRSSPAIGGARAIYAYVVEWWDNLPSGLRQDIEGSGAEPGCIAACRHAAEKGR